MSNRRLPRRISTEPAYRPSNELNMPCIIVATNVWNNGAGDRGDSFGFVTGHHNLRHPEDPELYYMNYHHGFVVPGRNGTYLIITTVGTARRVLHNKYWVSPEDQEMTEYGDKYTVCHPVYTEQQHILTVEDKRYYHHKRV
jgi:hypothetical protein